MINLMSYNGYSASMIFDAADKIIVGRVQDVDDIISFHGESVSEFEVNVQAAIEDYLRQLRGGSASGLSASIRYANSSAELAQLNATRASGGVVDFAKYQSTADTFLESSRDLFGSTTSYFRDLEAITNTVQGLVDKGQAEADRSAANQPVVDAITTQTTATVASLDAIRAAIVQQATPGANDNRAEGISGRIASGLGPRYWMNF